MNYVNHTDSLNNLDLKNLVHYRLPQHRGSTSGAC